MAKQPRVWSGSQWEPLAVTLPDLSNYSTTTQMNTAIDSSKGLTYITGTSFSASTSISINNCFSSTYLAYRIVATISAPSSDNYFRIRLRASGTDSSASYYGAKIAISDTGTTAGYGDNNSGSLGLFDMDSGNSGTIYSVFMDVLNPFTASRTTFTMINTGANTSTGQYHCYLGSGVHNPTTSYDGFTLYPDQGNVTGSVRVYGYRNS